MTRFQVVSLRPVRRHWRLLALAGLALAAIPALWREGSAATGRGGANPDVLWYARTSKRLVALTFDDGPGPSTPKILADLARYHAKATFFVVGLAARSHPRIVREEVHMGMEVGNHTYAHINLAAHSVAADRADLTHAQAAIRAAAGVTPTLMRPPYGAFNQKVVDLAKSLHLTTVIWAWTEDPKDWTNPGTAQIVSRVVSHIQPGDIVLMHDGGGDRIETERAVPLILRDLTAMGYRMVTVSELRRAAEPPAPPSARTAG